MPLYTLQCPTCGHEEEVLCKHDERTEGVDEDTGETFASCLGQAAVYLCPDDCGRMVWKGMELPQPVDVKGIRGGRFQICVVLENGQRVAGHFGKDARRERKKP